MKEFPPFRLDTVNQCLWRGRDAFDEERILLTPKAFAVLRYLVEHPGRLVTHDELLDALWPNTHVQPEVLKSHIFEARSILGDDSKKPLFIETLPRRGYRFIATVTEGTSVDPAPPLSLPTRLVGRDRPLRELQDLVRRTLRGERQIVFVTGEPGIGKTTVVDEFQRRATLETPGLRIARGQCIEGYGSKEAYYPMLEALAQLCRGAGGESVVQILAAQAPTWLVQFPALITREHRETLQREILGATRERMLREIGEALDAIASQSPLLLVFEDLQWVDYSTIDLISVLARRRTPARLMLIGTFREVDVALSDHPLRELRQDLLARQLCREVALEPLGEPHVVEYLVANAPGSPLPDGLAELVYRHSEGNPLFMVAALDHMTERSLISLENGSWQLRMPLTQIDLSVPENLRQMIEAQIERLAVAEQRVLEAASLTADLSFSVIARAAALDVQPQTFEDVCEDLSRRTHIVHPAESQELPDATISPFYEFAHALYREVLSARISPGRRATLHRRFAEWAETRFSAQLNEVAPRLAHHFEHGFDWARAIKYLRMVADTAGRRYAPREATAILQHALELSGKLPQADRALNETGILEQLATIYVVSFDMRAVEAYEALAARAAAYGLIDVEVRALIDMAYPLSWMSAERCLEVVDRALQLSARQHDPLMRARTRASCLVRRIWVGGWNAADAEDCKTALEDIRRGGDRLVVASHVMDCNFIRWSSAEYRAAQHDAAESLAVLLEGREENPYLSFAHWLSQFTMPWSLLFLGEWGEALRMIGSEIILAEKNGDHYRAQTLHLYRAWVHFHALDFDGVLTICESLLPSVEDIARTPWRRLCRILIGSAKTTLGEYEPALKYLDSVRDEMDHHKVIHDWYSRMQLEWGATELSLAQGNLILAASQAERFLQATLSTAERTWQALAWETGARVASAAEDTDRARACITKALSTMEGFDVPLAAWRVHATAADQYEHAGNRGSAKRHRELSAATILKLAHSLPEGEPLRKTFLSAPPVRRIVHHQRET